MRKMTYRPLPSEVTIKLSNIEGLGLFAVKDISCDFEFGITHVKDDKFEDGWLRTPLGGFFNHSTTPNCEAYEDGRYIKLKSVREIEAGEELTAFYWLYNLKV